MPITYNVHSGVQLENDIRFTLEVLPNNPHLKASGQMITDSDSNAFIYLLEDETGYHYLKFGQEVWPLLVTTLKAVEDPSLQIADKELTLHGFKEELDMLIFNIEGNDNYGAEFSKAVEVAFREILQA
ncbi:hypothetical protein SAMN05518871_101287 [Psychrobacillus sp. OK028]|uniref:UPF0738 family protein n=1 Tax=Psychrobacillus sp. OK028 TaxID=1884359 RepID=UPI00087F5815|nr:hypothetical protein [Psychrobacillus sp. OK028]SDM46223.1 hypothetical protein SAMN05518871_101287 [Psychrobacillus sp. OK028]